MSRKKGGGGNNKKQRQQEDNDNDFDTLLQELQTKTKEVGMAKRNSQPTKKKPKEHTIERAGTQPTMPAGGPAASEKKFGEGNPFDLIEGVGMCSSSNPEENLRGTVQIRKMLSVKGEPPYRAVVATDVPRRFVEFLSSKNSSSLQHEAACVLNKIADVEEHTKYLLTIDVALAFKGLLCSDDADCREQATWGLGNLTRRAECRDTILSMDLIHALVNILSNPEEKMAIHKNACWTLVNIMKDNVCRGRAGPPLEVIAPCLPAFVQLLRREEEEEKEIVVEAMRGISYALEGGPDRVAVRAALLKEDPLGRIISFLGSNSTSLVTPALHTIGSVVEGNETETQMVLDAGFLSSCHALLSHAQSGIRKETCWALSNILAGHEGGTTNTHAQMIIESNLLPPLLSCMSDQEQKVKKEAIWAIYNFTSGTTSEQISHLVELKGLDNLCEILLFNGAEVQSSLVVVLDACENILRYGQKYMLDVATQCDENPIAKTMLSNGGFLALERLQVHSNTEVSERAKTILNGYFASEREVVAEVRGDEEQITTETKSAENGADILVKTTEVNDNDPEEESPLHSAARLTGKTGVIQLLIAKGASDTATNNNKSGAKTPQQSKADAMMSMLISNGANVDDTDYGGMTPLHAAAQRGHLDSVRSLLTLGATVDAKDNKGKTPLDYATSAEMRNLLIKNGAKSIDTKNTAGHSNLHTTSTGHSVPHRRMHPVRPHSTSQKVKPHGNGEDL